MTISKYDILNDRNEAVNIIEWDGVSEWTPPPGHTVVPHDPVNWGVVPLPDPVVGPRVWSVGDFRSGMTLQEKIKWDNNNDPSITTVKTELDTPREVEYATELLDLLVSSGVISEATKDNILS